MYQKSLSLEAFTSREYMRVFVLKPHVERISIEKKHVYVKKIGRGLDAIHD